MLEWTMNVCVFQRPHEYFMLHSAVVEREGRALLMPGLAGSGKSTLCAGLVSRGWRLLSDEVALVRPVEGDLLPVPRPISLKEESIDVIRQFAPDAVLGPEWPGTAKGTVAHLLPPRESVQSSGIPSEPAWIVFPSFQREVPASLARLSKPRASLRAADNAFNYSVHGQRGFESLTRLVDRCGCYELGFGNLSDGVSAIEQLVQSNGVHPPSQPVRD
jgi:HprK-related kinase A